MSERLEVVNPWDLSPLAELEKHGSSDVEAALDTADRLHRDHPFGLPVSERVGVLEATADGMAARRDELALQIAREGGKPLRDAVIEADRAVEGVHLGIEALRRLAGREVPMNSPSSRGRMAFTHHEPIGPVVAVSAFNHPLNLIVHQVVPAVASGCPVIVKPAADTPLSCRAFVDILREAGMPRDWCRMIVTDDNEVAETLVTDRRVAFFSFIGSAKVGWHLRSRLAPGTRCALEHGGAAPVIIACDADLDDVLPLLTRGGFYHAGQVCVSVQRIYAHDSVAEEVGKRLAEMASELVVGDPASETTDVGPLIRPREVDRVEEWVEEARAGGARILTGGERSGETAYAPTVVADPPADARVQTREVFGPVVTVSSYSDLGDAIARANSLDYAFQASVCTQDLDTAIDVSRRLEASAVMVNDHTAFRVDWMPFGGRKQSGLGVGGIEHTMRDMLEEKMIVMRTHGSDPCSLL